MLLQRMCIIYCLEGVSVHELHRHAATYINYDDTITEVLKENINLESVSILRIRRLPNEAKTKMQNGTDDKAIVTTYSRYE